MSNINGILVAYCMKLTLLSASKGNNYYKHVEKTYNFRIKSETDKSAIVCMIPVPNSKAVNGESTVRVH